MDPCGYGLGIHVKFKVWWCVRTIHLYGSWLAYSELKLLKEKKVLVEQGIEFKRSITNHHKNFEFLCMT